MIIFDLIINFDEYNKNLKFKNHDENG